MFLGPVFKLLASFPSFSAGDSLEMTEQDYRPVTETNARHTNRETNSNKKSTGRRDCKNRFWFTQFQCPCHYTILFLIHFKIIFKNDSDEICFF